MAPHPSRITELGWEMINALPPVLRADPDYIAIMHCNAKESERLEATIEDARRQMNPSTASEKGLALWEYQLKIPNSGGSLEERRVIVTNRLKALKTDPSGAAWIETMNRRLGQIPWSYEESPPVTSLRRNYAPNPKAQVDTNSVSLEVFGDGGFSSSTITRVVCDWHPGIGFCFAVRATSADALSKRLRMFFGPRGTGGMPVRPGRWYAVSCHVLVEEEATGDDGDLYVGIIWYDALGVQVGSATTQINETDSIAEDERVGRVYQAPAGAAFAQGFVAFRTSSNGDVIDIRYTALLLEHRIEYVEGDPLLGDYIDGDMPGYDWTGVANASVTQEEALAPQTLRIFLPFGSGSPQWDAAIRAFEEESPSELALTFVSTGGFLLDTSRMDEEGMGV